jgi:hypothetical protein
MKVLTVQLQKQVKAGLVAMALLAVMGCGTHAAKAQQPARRDSVPRLVRAIEFKEYGSPQIRFGDLNGDGLPEAVIAQATHVGGENHVVISCLTAIDLEGKVLWQVGKPDIRNQDNGQDLPFQVYDVDRDGRAEVIYIPDEKNVLTILDGRTGKVKKQVQLAGGHDSILFADFSGRGYAQEVVVKDRYTSFWVYDAAQNFKLLWSKAKVNTGHYPSIYDFNHNGRDEMLCGYTLYSPDGKELWSRPEFPEHDDASYIDDMDGDGRAEIALATSAQAVLLDANGKDLFQKPMDHCQHAFIGKFRTDLPGKQAFYISRQESPGSKRADHALEAMYSKSGQLLWDNTGQKPDQVDGWLTQGQVVKNWTGNPGEDFMLLTRRGGPPILIDGHGRQVASFPFPPAAKAAEERRAAGGRSDGLQYDHYSGDYAQRFDCYGDERPEILIFNEKALYIYTNAALWQRPALYNDTWYQGPK